MLIEQLLCIQEELVYIYLQSSSVLEKVLLLKVYVLQDV